MTLVSVGGAGLWMPTMAIVGISQPFTSTNTNMLLDATGEEGQYIGTLTIDGGGSKTFGTSSKIGWLPGPTITFASGATLRVGLKTAAQITTTAGPPARATLGTAAYSVYKDLVGGTDSLTANTWRDDTMASGTPVTVNDGDLVALCVTLTVTSGTPLVTMNACGVATVPPSFPTAVLVTGGSTYTVVNVLPNVLLTFDDGTLGWLEQSKLASAPDVVTAAIGNGNSFANIVQLPFPAQIDALAAYLTPSAATSDFALELLSTPLGTPSVLASVAADANVMTATAARVYFARIPTPQTLAANTAYAMSVKQTTANTVTLSQFDVAAAPHFKPMGVGANCYAANSTGGATFVAQNSGLRRYSIWMRVSAVDDGTGGAASSGGGAVFGGSGGVVS